jgi:hypothetical protein
MRALKTKLKKVTATPKGRIIAFSILIFFIAAIAGGLWWWNTHKKGIIRKKLETAVLKKSNGLYKIKYDSLVMDEIAGYLSISNMNLTYDSTRYMDLDKQRKAPSILMNIHIPKISVSGVKTPRALIDNEIVGRKLEIINPVINIIYTNAGKDSSRVIPPKEVYEQILGNLDLIQADTVLISGAQITTSSRKTKKTSVQIQDVTIVLMDVKVDSTSSTDTTRMLFAKEISITCGRLGWTSANKLYNYRADSLSISSVSRHLRIKSFRLVPTLKEDAFVNALPTQDDRFDFSVSNIQLQNINMPQLFEENLVADSMLIGAATFKIYRDLAIPRDKKNRVGTYPQQVIEKIPVTFQVGKVILANGFLEYKERNNISRQSGKVQFYSVYASISNFTNDKKAIALNNVMTADMSSRFLNKTPMKVTWLFYLLNPKGHFDLKGSAGAIDGSLLNQLTEPMGPVSIKKGRINGVEFNLHGNDYGMDGSVKMLYEDLKVAMLEKDRGSKELDKKSLMSFLANIVIINSNPKKNEDVREMQVHLGRDINRSIYYLSWKTLFKGIKETVGVKK